MALGVTLLLLTSCDKQDQCHLVDNLGTTIPNLMIQMRRQGKLIICFSILQLKRVKTGLLFTLSAVSPSTLNMKAPVWAGAGFGAGFKGLGGGLSWKRPV